MEFLTPEIIKTLQSLSLPASIVIVFLILGKYGIWTSIKRWINYKINGDSVHEEEIQILKDFKVDAEDNHWHDIEDLKKDVKEISSKIDSNAKLIIVNAKDVAVIKSQVNDLRNK